MKLIPEAKQRIVKENTVNLEKIHWIFDNNTDVRIINEAYLMKDSSDDGFPVYIHAGNTDCESYSIEVETDAVKITSDGANGAFYALQQAHGWDFWKIFRLKKAIL